MTDPTTKELAIAIVEELKATNHVAWIDPETHSNHHECMEMMIAERKERLTKENLKHLRNERIKEKVMGTFVVGTCIIIVGLVGAGALAWLRDNQLIK